MTDPGWRDDPSWRLVDYDAGYWGGRGGPPARPPAEAELAQPDTWCSLYAAGRRLVATWARDAPSVVSAPSSTIAVSE